eukprot:gnl/Dysnectes_brevis/7957_a13814_262.p1 GENE.gnl/Dysnectes_brevis/7957_a13814_262~~gnl/Dysnectes_brevis/7957_a13814_262.p1  ORF type:complete len:241 (+),score=19.54 gnl/Dysnectes_brevis/7957_a13814_262:61-783(+)
MTDLQHAQLRTLSQSSQIKYLHELSFQQQLGCLVELPLDTQIAFLNTLFDEEERLEYLLELPQVVKIAFLNHLHRQEDQVYYYLGLDDEEDQAAFIRQISVPDVKELLCHIIENTAEEGFDNRKEGYDLEQMERRYSLELGTIFQQVDMLDVLNDYGQMLFINYFGSTYKCQREMYLYRLNNHPHASYRESEPTSTQEPEPVPRHPGYILPIIDIDDFRPMVGEIFSPPLSPVSTPSPIQ